MRDQSPRGTKSGSVGAASTDETGCLAHFVLDQRPFQLVLCDKKPRPEAVEVARFRLGSLTVAVLEDSDAAKSTGEAQEIIGKLTGRELQIAAMVAQGAATKNIAYELRISEWTVGTHLRRIFAKLNVDNRAAMVYRCAPLIKSATSANSVNGEPRVTRFCPRPADKEREEKLVKV